MRLFEQTHARTDGGARSEPDSGNRERAEKSQRASLRVGPSEWSERASEEWCVWLSGGGRGAGEGARGVKSRGGVRAGRGQGEPSRRDGAQRVGGV